MARKAPNGGSAIRSTAERSFGDLMDQIKAAAATKNRTQEAWLLDLAGTHSSSAIRRSAITALRALGSRIAWPQLITILATEHQNQNLRETAIKTLGELGDEATLTVLRRIAESGDVARFGQQAAVKALARLKRRLINKSPDTTATATGYRDLFLCHASEDKDAILRGACQQE